MANTSEVQNLKTKKEQAGFADRAKAGAENALSELAENFRHKLEDAGETAHEYAHKYGEQAREKASEALHYVERETRSNPIKALSIAFVTGIVTALLLGRRN